MLACLKAVFIDLSGVSFYLESTQSNLTEISSGGERFKSTSLAPSIPAAAATGMGVARLVYFPDLPPPQPSERKKAEFKVLELRSSLLLHCYEHCNTPTMEHSN